VNALIARCWRGLTHCLRGAVSVQRAACVVVAPIAQAHHGPPAPVPVPLRSLLLLPRPLPGGRLRLRFMAPSQNRRSPCDPPCSEQKRRGGHVPGRCGDELTTPRSSVLHATCRPLYTQRRASLVACCRATERDTMRRPLLVCARPWAEGVLVSWW
jgi:hypothetical protein